MSRQEVTGLIILTILELWVDEMDVSTGRGRVILGARRILLFVKLILQLIDVSE
jgi:hypothetical protein